MHKMLQTGDLVAHNVQLFAYFRQMAQSAQPADAKRLFQLFAQQEERRIEAAPDRTREDTMKKSADSSGKQVRFEVTAEPGSEVFVAGSFNNWNPTQYRMRDNPGSGHCKTAFVLPPGRHEYKFVVNGKWLPDPNGSYWAPDGNGTVSSVLYV